MALEHAAIVERRCVSKNVCHGVVYDAAFHARVGDASGQRASLAMIYAAMRQYLRRHPSGKKFHDPLAACCALDPSIVSWAEVTLVRRGGKWGSEPMPGSNTWISVAVDQDAFAATFVAM